MNETQSSRSQQQVVSTFHRCLLCPTQIRTTEIYCSPCGQDVWATRGNAEHGGKFAEDWKKLWAKIEKATEERKRANDQALPQGGAKKGNDEH